MGFEHRQEVIAGIIEWWTGEYLVTEGITSVKALADWAMERFQFLSKKENPLSYNTIRQEFGEVWRDLQQKNRKEQERKITKKNGKYIHNNLK